MAILYLLLRCTYNLSKYLQIKNIDLFNALKQVTDVVSVFHIIIREIYNIIILLYILFIMVFIK